MISYPTDSSHQSSYSEDGNLFWTTLVAPLVTQNEPKFRAGLLMMMTTRRMMTKRRGTIRRGTTRRMITEKMMTKTTMVRIKSSGASRLSYPSYVSETRWLQKRIYRSLAQARTSVLISSKPRPWRLVVAWVRSSSRSDQVESLGWCMFFRSSNGYANNSFGGELTGPFRALITAAVYLIGGIAYQRTVMHQRGWRQIPNYAMWAGVGNFLYVRKGLIFPVFNRRNYSNKRRPSYISIQSV